jgi:ribosomal protein S1
MKRHFILAALLALLMVVAEEPAMATRIMGVVVTGTVTSVSYGKITVDGKTYAIQPGSKLSQTRGGLKAGQRVTLELTTTADGQTVASGATPIN